MTFLDAQKSLCKKMNIDFADVVIGLNALWALEDIKSLINDAILEAYAFKPWDVSEGDKTIQLSASDITDGYINYPEQYERGSINTLMVNGKDFDKMSFSSYMKMKADDPTNDARFWAEHKGFIFINMSAEECIAGANVDVYGKLVAMRLTEDTQLMPFSPDSDSNENSGNNAVVNIAYAEALDGDKIKNHSKASRIEQKAFGQLEILWKQFKDFRVAEKPTNPMFDVPNFFGGVGPEIGTFNLDNNN